jgi:6-phosphofructokinase 2
MCRADPARAPRAPVPAALTRAGADSAPVARAAFKDVPPRSGVPPLLTVTVNPALDLSTTTGRVVSEHKLRCGPGRLDPGGGGVNVARVVHRLGGQALAVYTAGGASGEAYRRLIEAEHVPTLVVPIRESTRQNLTVDETTTGRQFRFVLEGPRLGEAEWRACLALVAASIPVGGYVVASGSLPPGVPEDFYARVARLARARGARCVVDASGPALREALAEGVFLVKPSRRELGEHVGAVLDTEQSQSRRPPRWSRTGPRTMWR